MFCLLFFAICCILKIGRMAVRGVYMRPKNGFTLLEVLTTMSIILIIASLLTTALLFSLEKSKKAECISNQRQILAAVLIFAYDEDRFPTDLAELKDRYIDNTLSPGHMYASRTSPLAQKSLHAGVVTESFHGNADILKCPKVDGTIFDDPPVYSYGLNELLRDFVYHALDLPSETPVIADCDSATFVTSEQAAFRHMGHAFSGYADGHVEWLKEFAPAVIDEDQPFSIDNGGLILAGTYVSQVHPLLAQLSYGGWYWDCNGMGSCRHEYMFDFMDMYLDLEVTTPEGITSLYNVTDPAGDGIDGWMSSEDLEEFFWESPEILEDCEINVVATGKWWVPKLKQVTGWRYRHGRWRQYTYWETYWEHEVYKTFNTNEHTGQQVWVLKDGDQVPDVGGFVDGIGSQTSIGEAVAPYTEYDDQGNASISLNENQAIYFWEMSHSPGQENQSGFDCNDLIFFMDLNDPDE